MLQLVALNTFSASIRSPFVGGAACLPACLPISQPLAELQLR
jgi:hypothetical protein